MGDGDHVEPARPFDGRAPLREEARSARVSMEGQASALQGELADELGHLVAPRLPGSARAASVHKRDRKE